jgi:hypothetical protein
VQERYLNLNTCLCRSSRLPGFRNCSDSSSLGLLHRSGTALGCNQNFSLCFVNIDMIICFTNNSAILIYSAFDIQVYLHVVLHVGASEDIGPGPMNLTDVVLLEVPQI